MAGRFEGKQALVLGVANQRSIAWAIAHRLAEEGAQVAFTYQGERIEKSVRDLATTVESPLVTECDVRSDDTSRGCSGRWPTPSGGPGYTRSLGRLRGGRGPRGAVRGHAARPLLDGDRHQRVLARRVRAGSGAADGGTRRGLDLTMTYLGGERAVPHYNVMGVAKSTLDSTVRVSRLGPRLQEHPRERDLGQTRTHARRALDLRLHDHAVDVRAAGAAPPPDRVRRLRRGGRLPALGGGRERHRHDPVRGCRVPRDGHVAQARRRGVWACASSGLFSDAWSNT